MLVWVRIGAHGQGMLRPRNAFGVNPVPLRRLKFHSVHVGFRDPDHPAKVLLAGFGRVKHVAERVKILRVCAEITVR